MSIQLKVLNLNEKMQEDFKIIYEKNSLKITH
jgi:hypothetical protein